MASEDLDKPIALDEPNSIEEGGVQPKKAVSSKVKKASRKKSKKESPKRSRALRNFLLQVMKKLWVLQKVSWSMALVSPFVVLAFLII